MTNISLSIGIPAHNESANIKALIVSLLSQSSLNYNLVELIVASDMSTDNTITEVSSVTDDRVRVIDGKERKGKMGRFNELADLFKGDLFLQLDADIKITDENLIDKMVAAYLDDPELAMVCGGHTPMPPKTYIEKLAYYGADTWERAIAMLGGNTDRYHCFGHIRLFSRKFLLNFRYPTKPFASEDVYSYYYCKSNGYKTQYVPDAKVYFRLPTNLHDYIKQMKRFVTSDMRMEDTFGSEWVVKLDTMTNGARLKALLNSVFHYRPDIIISYILLQLYTRYIAISKQDVTGIWETVGSTKKL